MNKDIRPLTVKAKDTILKAMQAINAGGIGLALIEDEKGKYFGLVTDGDIRRSLLAGVDLHDSIGLVARKDSVTVLEGMPYEKIFSMMNKTICHIPILDKKRRIKDLAHFSYKKDIPIARPFLKGNELKYVTECILGNWISSQGKYVVEFEKRFCEFCKTKYSLATSSGTVALHLALVSLGIGPGDEVIVPSFTFIATANAVTYTGAKPVFVDSEADTYNIDPMKIEKSITSRTKAIILVHLYGQPAKMDEIMRIARRHNFYVIEDAAEAHGAVYKSKRVGSISDIGCFSFFGNKIVTTGEGGMIVTNNAKVYKNAKVLRDHGMSLNKKYWHDRVGFNYRMTNIQAAIGCAQMEKVELILEEKQNIACMYKKYLSKLEHLVLPPEKSWSKNVFWVYPIVISPSRATKGLLRDKIIKLLEQDNIDARPFFYPIHLMPPYRLKKKFPIAERISKNGIMLPSYVGIQEKEIKRICSVVKKSIVKL